MSDDSLDTQLAHIQAQRRAAQRQPYRRSRLERYRAELLALAERGASHRDLAFWLRQFKRLNVHPTTVGRALSKWTPREQSPCPGKADSAP